MRNNSRINMTCQFIFKVGLPQWRSYTFFNECSLCTLYSSKEIPIAAILLNAAIYILRHCWFSNRQKEAAALKIKATASKARENLSGDTTAFFLYRRPADYISLCCRLNTLRRIIVPMKIITMTLVLNAG